ncbi:hypothetical protein [Microbacterium telephonicum]|uniref:Uncharacterized protein n=1 Tax=Microbacterium telephonicum TaxID=1714841 RepID=A0A498BTY3_9MICO|nr:hypothetical protein [Microbacterium telephonicum]RLK46427.1 hypothetical protein C7474_2965 [Microbacterium telephonicum]
MSQRIVVIENRVSKTSDVVAQGRQVSYRAQELDYYAQRGYTLAHTATVDGPDHVTFVDTLTADDPQ